MTEALSAKGVNGTVTLENGLVTIERRGFGHRGNKKVPLASIGGVQIKPPTAIVNGFIQFSIAGEVSRSAGGAGRSMNAAQDENAVIFTKKQADAFEAIREAVLAAATAPAAPTSVDVADQLSKLAALHDAGVLTDDEFSAKKTDLLARL